MEIAFSRLLQNDSWLFEQIIRDISTDWVSFEVEIDIHVFTEARWIVVPVGFGIPECFQDWVGLKKNVFYSVHKKVQSSTTSK